MSEWMNEMSLYIFILGSDPLAGFLFAFCSIRNRERERDLMFVLAANKQMITHDQILSSSSHVMYARAFSWAFKCNLLI